jgi:hypothetical protein
MDQHSQWIEGNFERVVTRIGGEDYVEYRLKNVNHEPASFDWRKVMFTAVSMSAAIIMTITLASK